MTRFLLFAAVFALSGLTRFSHAADLPAPPLSQTLPGPGANAFSISTVYGPGDGLLYVWNGQQVLKQDAPLSASFTAIGTVGSGSADAGPIAFSRDGSQLLVGNGSGGFLGGANAGLLFAVPSAGGDSNTAAGTVPFHFTALAAPLGVSNTRYFINQGNVSFTASSVSVFDSSTGANLPLVENIPGASTSMAISPGGQLFVGVGFGPQTGHLRAFDLADLQTAFDNATPLDWSAGTLFNDQNNNSGAGMFFDARGFLLVGGGSGVTVFDPEGNSRLYDNGGFTGIDYDPVNDRVLVTGFGNFQGVYSAEVFQVPEPSTLALVLMGMLALVPKVRRLRRSR